MTTEEMDQIVAKAVERILNSMPEIIGNMMAHQEHVRKLKDKFYKENPEFNQYQDIVVAIIEAAESEDLSKDYEKILVEAVPKIKRQIAALKGSNLGSVSKPNTIIDDSFNGVL